MKREKLRVVLVAVMLMAIVGMIVAGCGGESSETTTTSAPAGGDGGGKTIKLGIVLDLSFPLHVDWQKLMEAYVPYINETGVTIGGEKYTFELVFADGKHQAEASRAAVERLINQDKVDFILGDETADGWLSVTEAAGKLVIAASPTPGILQPTNKLAFNVGYWNTQAPIVWSWISENVPFQKVAGAYIDAAQGHAEADNLSRLAAGFGKEVTVLDFYPDGTQDFSAIATKIVNSGAEAFSTQGGGPVNDALLYKALRTAGYEGLFFNTVPLSPQQIAKVIPISNVEGLVGAVAAVDLAEPPATAAKLKELYTAKYGEWTNPDVGFISTFYCLLAALEKAQSLDSVKLAEVIGAGLEFDTPNGHAQMIARPDVGNERTIDACYETRIGKIIGEKSEVQTVISIADGLAAAQAYFATLKPPSN